MDLIVSAYNVSELNKGYLPRKLRSRPCGSAAACIKYKQELNSSDRRNVPL